MKRLLMQETDLFASIEFFSIPTGKINSGEMIELGNTIKDFGAEWTEVLSNSGVIGYIKGDAVLLDPDKYCYVAQEFVKVYENPDLSSCVVRTYLKNEEFYIIDKIDGAKTWYKIFDINGTIGYIEGDTCLKTSNVHGQKMITYEDYIKVYKDIDANSEILWSMLSGCEITLLNLLKDEQGDKWFQIETSKGEGYIKNNTIMLTPDEYNELKEDLRREQTEKNTKTDYDVWFGNFLYKKGIPGLVAVIILFIIWGALSYSGMISHHGRRYTPIGFLLLIVTGVIFSRLTSTKEK